MIAAQITWWDGNRNAPVGSCCTLSLVSGKPRIDGGRLGRDHILDGVPNDFVRDCIMNYINNEIPAPRRQAAARTSVFADLSDAEIAQYSALIQEDIEAVRRGDDPLSLLQDAEFEAMRGERPYRRAAFPINPIKNANEARSFTNQVKALKPVNTTIDLAPHQRSLRGRDYNQVEPIMRSVVRPLLDTYAIVNNLLPVEETLHRFRVGDRINWDCDQLRAMIKIFVTAPQRPFPGDGLYDEKDDPYSWTLDQFRLALKVVTRPELTTFLKQRGPSSGQASKVCQLVWEFFKKREMLGLVLVNAGVDYGDGGDGEVGGVQNVGEGEGGDQVGEPEEPENAEEDGPDDVGSDEFHDARETPGAVSVTRGASGSDSATSGSIISERAAVNSAGHGFTGGGVSDADEGEHGEGPVPEVDTGIRRSKRGRAATTTEPAAPPDPAPIKKRLRSGRDL